MRVAVAGGTGTVGRHVVALAQEAGHEVIVLSPSRGVDVQTGDGLSSALERVDTVIDVANPRTIERGPATEFFTAVAGNLQRLGAEQGVKHIVTLSIVGIHKMSFGYYQAKVEHERAAQSGSVPSTIMRATQFHELPAQLIGITRHDSHAHIFDVRVQSVAARTVADALIGLADAAPIGRATDLAGPQDANLVDLARAFLEHRGVPIEIEPDRDSMSTDPPGGLLPEEGARRDGPTFEEWLDSADAAALAI